MSVLFPEPVRPTIATSRAVGNTEVDPVERGPAPVIHRDAPEFDLSPHPLQVNRLGRGGNGRLLVKISLIRRSEALPRCIRFTTHPRAIIGQTSIPM